MSPIQQTYTDNTPSCNTSHSIENIQTRIQYLHQLNALLLLRVSQLEDIVHNITDNQESTYENIPDLEEITDEEDTSDNEGYDNIPDLEENTDNIEGYDDMPSLGEYISDIGEYDDMPDLEYNVDTDDDADTDADDAGDVGDQNAIIYHNCPLNNHPIYFNSSIVIV